tara:strand:- start:1379 stop:1642 length:264 start_codon:yes stop_codon:yes gene_type:complete
MSVKGSRHRLQPGEKSKHDECPIWANWEKKAKNKHIFIDERDDVPDELIEEIKQPSWIKHDHEDIYNNADKDKMKHRNIKIIEENEK